MLALVARKNVELVQSNVKITLLHKDLYMEQPIWFVVNGLEDMVCQLCKKLYGPKQVPHKWC